MVKDTRPLLADEIELVMGEVDVVDTDKSTVVLEDGTSSDTTN